MSEYIEREATLHRMKVDIRPPFAVVRDMPAADVVEVVRCGQCKHYHQYHVGKTAEPTGWGKCKLISMDINMTVGDFCSHGERKDNDNFSRN